MSSTHDNFSNQAQDENEKNKIFKTFGVGCFHFGLVKEQEAEFQNNSSYSNKLLEYLKKDNLIENISISEDINVYWRGLEPVDDHSIPEDGKLYPLPTSGSVSFTVHMSHRLQEEYLSDFRDKLKNEKIHVDIMYGHGLPVALITTETPEDFPSTAVVIIWRHLRKTSDSLASDMQFQMLGPSPFHADFYLSRHSENGLSISVQKNAGYDTFFIEFPVAIDAAIAYDIVKYRISDEARVYYETIRSRNEINSGLRFSLNELDELVSSTSKYNWVKARSQLAKIYGIQVELEKHSIRIEEYVARLNSEVKFLEQKYSEYSFKYKVTDELDELKKSPVSNYQRISETIKQRLSGSITNNTSIISAAIGAIFGAILTGLVTRFVGG